MAVTRRTIEICIKADSLLLMLSGIFIGLSGGFFLLQYRSSCQFFGSFYVTFPALFAVISGFLVLISGCYGCVLSSSDSSCLQGLFVYILIVIGCAVSTSAALAYVHRGKLDADLAPLKGVFQNYSGNNQDPDTKAVNALQSKLQCCGVKNYTDWLDTNWFNRSGKYEVPQSCCNRTFHTCNGTLDLPVFLNNEGCQIKFEKHLQLMLLIIIVASSVVVFALILSWICVGHLMRHRSPHEYRILDQE